MLDVRIRTGLLDDQAQEFLINLSKGKDRRLKYESKQVTAILKNLECTDGDKNDDVEEDQGSVGDSGRR